MSFKNEFINFEISKCYFILFLFVTLQQIQTIALLSFDELIITITVAFEDH